MNEYRQNLLSMKKYFNMRRVLYFLTPANYVNGQTPTI